MKIIKFLSIFMIEFIVKSMTEECSGNWSLSSDGSKCVFLFPRTSTTEPVGPVNKTLFNGSEAEDVCYIAGGYLMHTLELPEAEVILRSQNISNNLTLIMRLQPDKGRVRLFPVLDDSGNILEQPYMNRSEFKCACSEWNVTMEAPDLTGAQISPLSNNQGHLSVPEPCSCQRRGQIVCLREIDRDLESRCERPLPLQPFNNVLSNSGIPKYFNSTSRKPYPSEFSLDYASVQTVRFVIEDPPRWEIPHDRVNQYEVELPDYWKLSSLFISTRFLDEQNFRIHFLERNMSWKSYFVKDSLNDTIPYVPKGSKKVGQKYEIRLSKPVVGNYFIIEDWPTNFSATVRSDGGFGIKLFGCPMNMPYEYTKTKFVSGSMQGNRVWSPSDGVIVVNDSLTIAPSDALTIQPGVQVYLRKETILYIDGNLTIDGTESNPIELSSFWPTVDRVYTGDSKFYPWESLLVSGTGRLKMSNAILQHVKTGIVVRIAGSIAISNVKIYHSNTAVNLFVAELSSTITDILINRAKNGLKITNVIANHYFLKMGIQNVHFGIAIYGYNTDKTYGKVVIQASLFSFCNSAIMSDHMAKLILHVSDSSFIENNKGLEILTEYPSRDRIYHSLRLVNNSLLNNKVHHVVMLYGDITILNNTFNGKGRASFPPEYKIIGNKVYNTENWDFNSAMVGLISKNVFFNTTLKIEIEISINEPMNLSILENYFENSENSAVIMSTGTCYNHCKRTLIHLVNIKKNHFIHTATDSYVIKFLNTYGPTRIGGSVLKSNISDNTFHKIGQLQKHQMVRLQSEYSNFLNVAAAIYGAFYVYGPSVQLNIGFNKFTQGIGQVMAIHWNENGTPSRSALLTNFKISVLKNEITDWSLPPDTTNFDNFIHSLISIDLAPIRLLSNPISQTGPVYELSISENIFRDCQAGATVYFKSLMKMSSSHNQICNKILKNTLQQNNFTSTILLNAIDLSLEENFFSNAPSTSHELSVIYSNGTDGTVLQNATINANYNWLGSSNATVIQTIILDEVSDPRYEMQCVVSVCETCSNHGICTSPNRCTCFKGYKADTNCSTCEDGFFVGKDDFCNKCPSTCTHGTCKNSKWAGPLCSDCSERHIGYFTYIFYISYIVHIFFNSIFN